jgi:hypothetical protein
MYFILSFILYIFSIIELFSKQKYVRIFLFILSILLFFILLGFNSFSPDLENYKIHYENFNEDFIKFTIEPVFLFLMNICNSFGLKFDGYQIVYSILIFFFFGLSLLKYSPYPIFVLSNFYLIPFFPDITQIRFFLGFAIFLYSLKYYEKKKKLFYVFLILSILCHYSLLFFLLFPMLSKTKIFYNQIKSCILILISILILSQFSTSILEPIISIFNLKYLDYLGHEKEVTFLGTFVLIMPFFIINNLVIWHYNNSFRFLVIGSENKYKEFLPILINIIRFSNYLLILVVFIRDFSRISQNVYILVLVYFTIVISFLKEKKVLTNYIRPILFILFYTIFLFYFEFLMINNFEYFEIINKTFLSNSLFN